MEDELQFNDGSVVTVDRELDGDGLAMVSLKDVDNSFILFMDAEEWAKLKDVIDSAFTRKA